MENMQHTKTEIVNQKMFPGCHIENKWGRYAQLKRAPAYAMRIFLSAKVTHSVQGNEDFVSLTLDGTEYALHKDNFKLAWSLCELLLQRFVSDGYDPMILAHQIRSQPNLIIDSLYWLTDKVHGMYDIPLDVLKMLWWLPDNGVCGEYRSTKPYKYLQANINAGICDGVYAEHTSNIDSNSVDWFDVYMMHRVPPLPIFNLYQRLHAAGKTLIYEWDDDLFNVPAWNHNSRRFGLQEKAIARNCMQLADVILCSTEALVNASGFPDKALVAPNLVDVNEWDNCYGNRTIDMGLYSYVPVSTGNKIKWIGTEQEITGGKRPDKTTEEIKQGSRITILWAGSNTHDDDLQQIIDPILSIGRAYGVAVNFVFFGYIPPQFVDAEMTAGNQDVSLRVKQEYQHFITFIEGVPFKRYGSVVNEIKPDFALCPLKSDIFNLSKSNLKVIELGAMHIPSIATDFGPYRFISNAIDGLLCRENNPNDWHENICQLIESKSMRDKLSNGIYNTVLNKFSWNTSSENTELWDKAFAAIKEAAHEKKQESIRSIRQYYELDSDSGE